MSTFTLAISCLATSNLPWFMDLTFQVPIQYCSLPHQTLFSSPVTSTTGCWFCFGSISSFFLELFLYWSPVAYWAPTHLGSSSFSILSFCLFILFMGFSRQEYWAVCHSLLQWTTFCQTSPPWPAHCGWPHRAWLSFIKLDKAVVRAYGVCSHYSPVILFKALSSQSSNGEITLDLLTHWGPLRCQSGHQERR